MSEVLGELLERWGAGRASTPAEKRISARLAAQLAETADGPDSPFFPHIAKQIAAQMAEPDLGEELGLVSLSPALASQNDDPLALTADELIDEDLDDIDLLEDLRSFPSSATNSSLAGRGGGTSPKRQPLSSPSGCRRNRSRSSARTRVSPTTTTASDTTRTSW